MQRLSGEDWTNQGFQPDRWSSTVQVRGKIGRWDKGGEPSRHTRALDHRAQRGHHAARVGTSRAARRQAARQPARSASRHRAGRRDRRRGPGSHTGGDPRGSAGYPTGFTGVVHPFLQRRPRRHRVVRLVRRRSRCRGSRPPGRRLHHGPARHAAACSAAASAADGAEAAEASAGPPKPGKPDRETRKEERRKEKAEEREKRSEKDERREEKRRTARRRSRTARTRRTTAATGTDAGRQPRLARLTP